MNFLIQKMNCSRDDYFININIHASYLARQENSFSFKFNWLQLQFKLLLRGKAWIMRHFPALVPGRCAMSHFYGKRVVTAHLLPIKMSLKDKKG